MIGPIRWDALLHELPQPRKPGQRGPNRKRGDQLPRPRQMIDDTVAYPAQEVELGFGDTTRTLRVQVIRGLLWYALAGRDYVLACYLFPSNRHIYTNAMGMAVLNGMKLFHINDRGSPFRLAEWIRDQYQQRA